MKLPIVCACFLLSMVALSAAAEKVWKLEIVPSRNSKGKGAILYAKKPQDNFYIILHNVSGREQRVWRDWCPWGYDNLSLIAELDNGKKVTLTRTPNKWDKTYPDAALIPAGKSYVFAVRLAGKTWSGLEKLNAAPFKLTVRYRIKASPEAKQKRVWVGEAQSVAETFTLRK
ncbi:MAG: hypothetical protein ACPGUY_09085 [Akkermansiaceae bacterium]